VHQQAGRRFRSRHSAIGDRTLCRPHQEQEVVGRVFTVVFSRFQVPWILSHSARMIRIKNNFRLKVVVAQTAHLDDFYKFKTGCRIGSCSPNINVLTIITNSGFHFFT